MSKLALASLCAGLLSCAAQQAEYYIDQLADSRRQVRLGRQPHLGTTRQCGRRAFAGPRNRWQR